MKQTEQIFPVQPPASQAAEDPLIIGDTHLSSRLLLGTGKYGDLSVMRRAISEAGSQMVTVALRRIASREEAGGSARRAGLLEAIPRSVQQGGHGGQPGSSLPLHLLPNTSGARNAREAVLAAELARELLQTPFIKLEIHPDPAHLLPDPVETLEAAAILAAKGFVVLPYVHADPVLCKRLEQVGVAAVMPLGAPIGSNLGLRTRSFLEIIIQQAVVPVIVDAGIGSPSDAALAMEMGADAVLISTAVATAMDPAGMARAFKLAVAAGRLAHIAGLGSQGALGEASSPLTDFLS